MKRRDRLLILGFWTLLGLLESSKTYVWYRVHDIPWGWSEALIGNMPWWYVWALLTPFAFALAHRFRFDESHRVVAVLVHFGAALVFTAVHLSAVGVLYYYTTTRGLRFDNPGEQIQTFLNGYLVTDVLTYFAVIGGYYAIEFHRRFRERELAAARLETRAAQLEAGMVEARLSALRMQLNPHFLFNTLNAISGLVRRREHDDAVRMLARLGELLRVTLDQDGAHEVPLEQELALLRQYLEIEQIRFRDRLVITLDVSDAARDALVPALILQPIAENAVRYGVAGTTGPARIVVCAQVREGALILEVQDSGPGFGALGQHGHGVGLDNVRARLEQLYGSAGTLTLENADEGGARVTLTLPLRREAQPRSQPKAELREPVGT